jgi:hypothetical protein
MTNQLTPERRQRIRHAVRFFYDVQKLRIQSGNRSGGQAEDSEIELDDDDIAFMKSQSDGLEQLEAKSLKEITRLIKKVPIYEEWLKEQRGCGPTMAGVILSEFNIHGCDTPSKMWAYCGLGVADDGRTMRRQEGKKAGFNPWLKGKMVNVLAGCIIKASGGALRRMRMEAISRKLGDNYLKSDEYRDFLTEKFPDLPPSKRASKGIPLATSDFLEAVCEHYEITLPRLDGWVGIYENYKHRKVNQILDKCMNCKGSGVYTEKAKGAKGGKRVDEKTAGKSGPCANCKGTGGPAPWGFGAAHRNNAAKRYMIKIFLRELWWHWRTLEGLPTPPDYAEQYLGMKHGSHGPDQALLAQVLERRNVRLLRHTG